MLHADNYEEGDDILHILKNKTGVSFISMELADVCTLCFSESFLDD